MNRRDILKILAALPLSMYINPLSSACAIKSSDKQTFEQLLSKAIDGKYYQLKIGEIMGRLGIQLLGTPYKGGTLETPGKEVCSVYLNYFDCVTFYETVMDMARIIQKTEYNFNALVKEVKMTRYRNGNIEDYTSRLHYTSDWIFENVKNGVVDDITKKLGGQAVQFDVSFMTENPQYYEKLKNNPAFVRKMKEIEKNISERTYYIIPHDKIKNVESNFRTGDIIALTSNVEGLDYAHTGFIYKDGDIPLFLNASSDRKKVFLDDTVSNYVERIGKKQAITVVRPLNVK